MARFADSKSQALLALTSSALLLPAYQAARADAPPENTLMSLRYSKYEEDDVLGRQAFGPQSERFEIDIAQFHLVGPVSDDWSIALDIQYEDMSGASPWFVGASASGDPQVIMSAASIADTRTDISVTTRYYYDRGNSGLTVSHSDEDDYESWALGADTAWNSEDGMTTYSAAVSASDDDIDPTQGSYPTNTESDSKNIYSAWVGVSRIISRQAIVQFGLSYTLRDGFLTDPYKGNDQRPDEREEWAASLGYRHFFAAPNAALHVDYRYFDDDWGINSQTLELSWHQNVFQRSQLIPHLRYYSQGEADFFANVVDESQRYYADDYRLSSYGALTAGLSARTSVDDWTFIITGERYVTDESWSLYNGDESPGLVKFWRFSVGIDYILN
jgi:hypothetical protein